MVRPVSYSETTVHVNFVALELDVLLLPELFPACGLLGQDAVIQVIAVFCNGWCSWLLQLDVMVCSLNSSLSNSIMTSPNEQHCHILFTNCRSLSFWNTAFSWVNWYPDQESCDRLQTHKGAV